MVQLNSHMTLSVEGVVEHNGRTSNSHFAFGTFVMCSVSSYAGQYRFPKAVHIRAVPKVEKLLSHDAKVWIQKYCALFRITWCYGLDPFPMCPWEDRADSTRLLPRRVSVHTTSGSLLHHNHPIRSLGPEPHSVAHGAKHSNVSLGGHRGKPEATPATTEGTFQHY